MNKSRNTNQKQLILNTISNMYHPSAEEIYEKVKSNNLNIGRATVFRNVSNLTDEGKLIRINVPQGADRFEVSVEPHSHFVCKECKNLYDIPYVPKICLPETDEYVVDGYSLTFTGICKKCLEKNGGK